MHSETYSRRIYIHYTLCTIHYTLYTIIQKKIIIKHKYSTTWLPYYGFLEIKESVRYVHLEFLCWDPTSFHHI